MRLPQITSGLCEICFESKESMIHNLEGDGKSYCLPCLSRAISYYKFHVEIGEDL